MHHNTSRGTPRNARRHILAAAAVTCAALLPTAGWAQTILKASPFGPPNHLLTKKILLGWADAVGTATEGRVKVELLPAAVAPPPAILDAITSGAADVSLMSNGASARKLPLNALVEFAGQTPSSEKASLAYQGIVQKYPALAGEFGVVQVLGVFTHGPGVLLLSRNGVAGQDDFSKLTINAGGAGGRAVALDLGAKPVMSAHPPRPEVLAEGQADATVTTIDSYGSFNLAEAVKGVVTLPGGFYTAGFAMVANSAKWKTLDARDQMAIMKVSGPVLARLAGQAWDQGDAEATAKIRAVGVPISTLTPSQTARMAAAGDQRKKAWLESLGGNAKDAEAALAEYRAQVSMR
ncbi:MAG: hypothetical protein V4718_02620 [Pseudomonadota bacterium]